MRLLTHEECDAVSGGLLKNFDQPNPTSGTGFGDPGWGSGYFSGLPEWLQPIQLGASTPPPSSTGGVPGNGSGSGGQDLVSEVVVYGTRENGMIGYRFSTGGLATLFGGAAFWAGRNPTTAEFAPWLAGIGVTLGAANAVGLHNVTLWGYNTGNMNNPVTGTTLQGF